MAGIVIVALPAEDDPVWVYSSEKKPHMTLLYMNGALSDEETAEITKYVQHASDVSLNRFGLSVDRRGTLGDENADVLFFETEYGVPNLRNFRSMLLKNDAIARNYVKAEQFPGWIPHLTMGYPNSPAKEIEVDNRHLLRWINFDRVAIWFDNYEGPEFELSGDDGLRAEDAYWSEDHGVYLMHYGVNGMRWGVRRSVGPNGLVTGTVKDAIDSGQTPSSAKTSRSESLAKGRRSKKSVDQKQFERNIKKDVSSLSTSDIKQITARIKAMNELKKEQKAIEEANASRSKKLAKFVGSNVAEGTKQFSQDYIRSMTKMLLGKSFPSVSKIANSGPKNKSEDQTPKENGPYKDDRSSNPRDEGGRTRTVKAEFINTDSPQPERAKAIEELVYEITTLKEKEG